MDANLKRRLGDRSFLLTIAVLVLILWGILNHIEVEKLFAFVLAIAPFVFGEKHKDAASQKSPDTLNIGQADTVKTSATSPESEAQ